MLNFLGIGAQKSGTTWLYERLGQHPGIRFPAGKEVHFWDARRHLGIDWYRQQFTNERLVEGEITPAYALLPPADIADIRAAFPDLRLIFLCRNPIDRAWSAALMAMQRAELMIHEVSDQWFIDHVRSAGSRARGDYATAITNWRSVFDPDRLLVADFDEIARDPVGLLQACCRHVGADPAYFSSRQAEALSGIVFSGPTVPIRPRLLAELNTLYCAEIEALAGVLPFGVDHWLGRRQCRPPHADRSTAR